jgi:membrane protein
MPAEMRRRPKRGPTKLTLRQALGLFGPAFESFYLHRALGLGAALAFYTVFSIPPLLIFVVGIGGQIFGKDAAAGRLASTLSDLIGVTGAQALQDILGNVHREHQGPLPTVVGIATLLVGATGVFGQLKDALDTIWGVAPRPGHALALFLRKYVRSLALLIGTGFLLLVSLALNALLASLGDYLGRTLPGGQNLWAVLNSILSLGAITFLFALMLRFIPDVRVAWKDALVGGSLTATLFTVGESLIGYYLGRTRVGSAFGLTGSVVVLLLWVYYSSMIFLYGAEYTKVFALRRGERIVPDAEAQTLSDEHTSGSYRKPSPERGEGPA